MQILSGQTKNLGGGLTVQRLLPALGRQAVGPFLFMDHFGPVAVEPSAEMDVRPHPHVGLATVTYLFDGALMHRDSLGCTQRIIPGDINWMTAGRGIVHSERRPDDLRQVRHINHGLQLWVALPQAFEACPPSFVHAPANTLPHVDVGQANIKVLVGGAFGQQSPVETFTQTIYLDVELPAGGSFDLPALAPELAIYPVDSAIWVGDQVVEPRTLAVLPANTVCKLRSQTACRLMVLGGESLDGPRFMWWNFVASRKETLAMAAQDWSGHVFGYVVDETEMAPLPERRTLAERRKTARQADLAAERRSKVPKSKATVSTPTRPPASEK